MIEPCPPIKAVSDLHILFYFEGIAKPGEVFKPNHFVPLIFQTAGDKRKLQRPASSSLPKKICSNNKIQSKLSFPTCTSVSELPPPEKVALPS